MPSPIEVARMLETVFAAVDVAAHLVITRKEPRAYNPTAHATEIHYAALQIAPQVPFPVLPKLGLVALVAGLGTAFMRAAADRRMNGPPPPQSAPRANATAVNGVTDGPTTASGLPVADNAAVRVQIGEPA